MSAKTQMLLWAALALCCPAHALNDLGTLDQARAEHPAVFVPGNVLAYTIAGVQGYVFNGEAERCFTGTLAESDADLYREAVLDAKKNLRNYLAKRTPSSAYQLSAVRKLYEYTDGKMRRVVLFVERVRRLPQPTD